MTNFDIQEFACKHCGQVHMDSSFLEMIDEARRLAGIPFVVNSGYRCPEHNAAVGSTSENHTSGKAADLACQYGPDRMKIIGALIKAGFRRIGIAKTFIHADNMDGIESIWLYG
jgi:zinc D-Ala-D-Ala carboxypeptidase